ncbi:hypothetical protein ADU80_04850 [Clostridium botulinum]|uniref:hypothetical protein n=1 Tax=Clostridium botulinum TaxID=1491 RepID=UPI0002075004|nr:hypothetical protein [Clostridium botulinum]AEB77656.1 hypothetical protein CbC4_7045 [Clostridium botulinum BKT015925]KLU74215.1 hypothetical protein CBC3_p0359 [Clostridium botulinum V891]KLU74236.1 hypothetical protein CBC3_p0234 [Clostridium botulinum V891]KOA86396.1 hypothetical protein ADU80_04850 [Clostridium botulinum]KOC34067.1 hypothetical protein ADU82_10810 [Clostridium botulinum]
MKLKIITKQGEFETNSDWQMELLTRNLNLEGFNSKQNEMATINIGDYIFRKGDVIRVEIVKD